MRLLGRAAAGAVGDEAMGIEALEAAACLAAVRGAARVRLMVLLAVLRVRFAVLLLLLALVFPLAAVVPRAGCLRVGCDVATPLPLPPPRGTEGCSDPVLDGDGWVAPFPDTDSDSDGCLSAPALLPACSSFSSSFSEFSTAI